MNYLFKNNSRWELYALVVKRTSRERLSLFRLRVNSSAIFQAERKKKSSFHHLDRDVHYCVKSDQVTLSGQF